jgi:hypothetical protein
MPRIAIAGLDRHDAGAAPTGPRAAGAALLARFEGTSVTAASAGAAGPADFARRVAPGLRRGDVDGVILCVEATAHPHQVRAALRLVDRPALLLSLPADGAEPDDDAAAGGAATARRARTSVAELAFTLRAERVNVDVVAGRGDCAATLARILQWTDTLDASKRLAATDIGILSAAAEGMPRAAAGLPALSHALGLRFVALDSADLARRRDAVSRFRLRRKLADFAGAVDIGRAPAAIEAVLRTACALDDVVWATRCGAIVHCPGTRAGAEDALIERTLAAGAALLNGRGLPVAGRGGVNAAAARCVLEALGAPAACAERVGRHIPSATTAWAVDVPHRHLAGTHRARLDGELRVTQALAAGPVTALALVEPAPGMLVLRFAEGMIVDGPDGRCDVALDASPDRFTGARCALGRGHAGLAIERLARYLNLDAQRAGQGLSD